MRAVFADTFYWAALTWTKDPAHQRALEFSRTFDAGLIITIDEVLSEYLTFFAGAPTASPCRPCTARDCPTLSPTPSSATN